MHVGDVLAARWQALRARPGRAALATCVQPCTYPNPYHKPYAARCLGTAAQSICILLYLWKGAGGRAGREFMQDRPDGLFLVLEQSLLEHIGSVSSQNNTFWIGNRFVDSLFWRVPPATRPPEPGEDGAVTNGLSAVEEAPAAAQPSESEHAEAIAAGTPRWRRRELS